MTTFPRAGRRAPASRAGRPQPSAHPAPGSRVPPRSRLLALLALPLIGGMSIGTVLGQPRGTVTALTAAQAEQLGTAVTILQRRDVAAGLAEVRVPGWTVATREARANRLLALSPDGSLAAVAAQVGPEPSTLILAHSDGSQLQVRLGGLMAAGFSPDAAWLAVIDGAGSLWRVDASSGQSTRLADGPFLGTPVIDAAGSILTLRVASVEAPFVSRLARVAPRGAAVTLLTDDQLVYGVQQLDDGSLAVIAHQPSGTVLVQEDGGGARRLLANLGRDAVNVAVAPSGSAVAWERAGEVFVQELPGGQPYLLARGARPRFGPNGQTLLVEVQTGSVLLDLQARPIATFASQVAFGACGDGCRP